MTGQEATVIDIGTEVDALASWPTRERTRALKRIIPRARVEAVLARTGHDRTRCPRLPGWFLVWFVVALEIRDPTECSEGVVQRPGIVGGAQQHDGLREPGRRLRELAHS